ncbi:uncharacterized protein DKFZp434B061 isoform X1 [Triticum aestivum]|uniref:uncharacterized protein DKFZp434B061 isoform X1 n=1 Tax=Triticum aestivum TaxID=4565 RepID=UPI001D01CE00|nr:uncharacterized protein DKFZp434B061-like isoform X1 [Triticum aestivum]
MTWHRSIHPSIYLLIPHPSTHPPLKKNHSSAPPRRKPLSVSTPPPFPFQIAAAAASPSAPPASPRIHGLPHALPHRIATRTPSLPHRIATPSLHRWNPNPTPATTASRLACSLARACVLRCATPCRAGRRRRGRQQGPGAGRWRRSCRLGTAPPARCSARRRRPPRTQVLFSVELCLRCALRAARSHAVRALHQLGHLHQQGGCISCHCPLFKDTATPSGGVSSSDS